MYMCVCLSALSLQHIEAMSNPRLRFQVTILYLSELKKWDIIILPEVLV